MKKYIALFAALLALVVSSCSNDDLEVGQAITFKVNPNTVVSPFTKLEYKPGDITSLPSTHILHVGLYIYDATGNLVVSETKDFSDYNHIMTSIQNLHNGSYTAVAVTHVDSDIKFWSLSGTEKLSTFTMTDGGYIGGPYKILGLSAKKINITSDTKEVAIDVECAGAVARVDINNWNKYSDVESFSLDASQSCDEVVLNNNGELQYSFETSSDFDWYLAKWTYKPEVTGARGYYFMFPYKNITMTFAAETSDTWYKLGGTLRADIEKNHAYYFIYDVEANENSWNDVTGTSGRPAKSPALNAETVTLDNMQYDLQAKTIKIAQ
ncbi:MAG: hypothetical protein ACI4AM_06400 [Muribaculaceae bacterium]